MKSENSKKLSHLIDFLRFDANDPKGLGGKDGYKNVELAAAQWLELNFRTVLSKADGLDETEKELKA